MEIIEFNNKYIEQVKDLFVELQNYVIKLDKYNLNTISKDYRDKYFEKTISEVYNNQGKMFLAMQNNAVVGVICGFVQCYSDIDRLDYTCPKKGIISELIVSAKSRGMGVGDMLIIKMEDYLKSLNCKYCELDVFAYNQNAIKFYNKYNYQNRMVTMFKEL